MDATNSHLNPIRDAAYAALKGPEGHASARAVWARVAAAINAAAPADMREELKKARSYLLDAYADGLGHAEAEAAAMKACGLSVSA